MARTLRGDQIGAARTTLGVRCDRASCSSSARSTSSRLAVARGRNDISLAPRISSPTPDSTRSSHSHHPRVEEGAREARVGRANLEPAVEGLGLGADVGHRDGRAQPRDEALGDDREVRPPRRRVGQHARVADVVVELRIARRRAPGACTSASTAATPTMATTPISSPVAVEALIGAPGRSSPCSTARRRRTRGRTTDVRPRE